MDFPYQLFYELVILPQFGIEGYKIMWVADQTLGPDETAHRFTIDGREFILIYEDFNGLGRDASFIKENLNLDGSAYEFVPPLGERDNAPSFTFVPKVPYRYIDGVTGTFTLLQILIKNKAPLEFTEHGGVVHTNALA